MCICWFSVPCLKSIAFNCHVVINETEVHFPLARGDWKKTLVYLTVCVCSSQPTRISSTMSTNYLPVSVTFKAVTNYGFLYHVIYQKHIFNFMLHYTLSPIYLCTIIKPILTHSENVQATHGAGLQEISC
jgi:hypothetical protein